MNIEHGRAEHHTGRNPKLTGFSMSLRLLALGGAHSCALRMGDPGASIAGVGDIGETDAT